jgi:hypothetical protein
MSSLWLMEIKPRGGFFTPAEKDFQEKEKRNGE